MSSLKDIFEKQGGMNLIRQYIKSGSLGTSVTEFLLLGKSRTALEILRLAAELKTRQKLEREYKKVLEKFDAGYASAHVTHNSSDIIWVCWFQGMENAPLVVKKCYESLQEHLSSKKIILITRDNMAQYAHFPEYILDKWQSGKITDTHMTDLLRLELLTSRGGTWIDATVLCTADEEDIPDYFFNSDLFFYQCLKPGRDGQSTYMSSWFISAKSHNKVLEAAKRLCHAYWKKNNELIDYYLLHYFLSIALERYPEEWQKIIPRDNATPHELLLRLFDPYDERMWKAIEEQTPFHKLSYKFSDEQIDMPDTYYKKVL